MCGVNVLLYMCPAGVSGVSSYYTCVQLVCLGDLVIIYMSSQYVPAKWIIKQCCEPVEFLSFANLWKA